MTVPMKEREAWYSINVAPRKLDCLAAFEAFLEEEHKLVSIRISICFRIAQSKSDKLYLEDVLAGRSRTVKVSGEGTGSNQ